MSPQVQHFIDTCNQVLEKVGGERLSIASIGIGILAFCAVLGFSTILRLIILPRALRKFEIEKGIQYAILALVRYLLLCIAVYLGLVVAGFDMTSLTVLVGALGVGIGFGLQVIFQNFISGLIILFERPIKVGDYVDLGDLTGMIEKISIRSTTIRTNDNVSVIVPNSEFVSSRVVNWSHGSPEVRLRVPIGVAYGSDVELVKKVLLEVATEHNDVLKDPGPTVFFESFGDSSLNFELGVWRNTEELRPGRLISDLNFAIDRKFREHDIEIPFPQRDIHIKSQPDKG